MSRKNHCYCDLSRTKHTKYHKIKVDSSWYHLIVTWFFIGRAPIMPGTFGTLGFYPLYYFIIYCSLSPAQARLYLTLSCIGISLLGYVAVAKFQNETLTSDHPCVVVDEIIGINITLAIAFNWLYKISLPFVGTFGLNHFDIMFAIAFILFRAYDIYKPLFIRYIDRHCKTPLGVLLDDVLAGLFAALTIYLYHYLYAFFY